MKYIFLFLIVCLNSHVGFSQIDAKELVVLHTANTVVEMNAIANPITGSLIFNAEDKKIYVFDGTNWINEDLHTPYITNRDVINIQQGQTRVINVNGVHFTPSTIFSMPGFDGTVNSVSIVSPTQIDVDLTANSPGFYDFVVTNSGVTNTVWPGNGDELLHVANNNGTSKAMASLSCKTILDDGYSTGDGNYWVNPDGGSTDNAFQVYCDMTTNGGGWTRIEYTSNLVHNNHYGNTSDGLRWLPSNFSLNLTNTQINDIRSTASEGKQSYVGSCQGVIHHRYQLANYGYAFGFRYHTGFETVSQSQTYPNTNIVVASDGCFVNNNVMNTTVFNITDIRVPVINVRSRDNGSSSEKFGSDLTSNHAWLR